MMRTALFATAWFFAAAASSTVFAQNLLPNPGFDTDIAGWTSGSSIDLFWEPEDEEDLGGSGSLRAERVGGTSIAVFSSCIPVTPGTVYTFGGSLRIPESLAGRTVNAQARLRFTDTLICSGSLDSVTSDHAVRFPGSWGPAQGTAVAPPGAVGALLIFSLAVVNSPATLELAVDNAYLLQDRTCALSPTTLCLNDRRFRVWSEWERPDGSRGFARIRTLTNDSGLLWFFNSANIELVTKVLDGCAGPTQRYWVFAAGLTNVGVTLHVRDTVAGETRTYENPLGQAFLPIQDTAAFATCP
ncbi:MAG: hypothetical protein KDD47_23585 [Acidobacteria bacterium]|nr:hypothetical protein [Acidobacteriota bacterium]